MPPASTNNPAESRFKPQRPSPPAKDLPGVRKSTIAPVDRFARYYTEYPGGIGSALGQAAAYEQQRLLGEQAYPGYRSRIDHARYRRPVNVELTRPGDQYTNHFAPATYMPNPDHPLYGHFPGQAGATAQRVPDLIRAADGTGPKRPVEPRVRRANHFPLGAGVSVGGPGDVLDHELGHAALLPQGEAQRILEQGRQKSREAELRSMAMWADDFATRHEAARLLDQQPESPAPPTDRGVDAAAQGGQLYFSRDPEAVQGAARLNRELAATTGNRVASPEDFDAMLEHFRPGEPGFEQRIEPLSVEGQRLLRYLDQLKRRVEAGELEPERYQQELQYLRNIMPSLVHGRDGNDKHASIGARLGQALAKHAAARTLRGWKLVIDRPRGTRKTFRTPEEFEAVKAMYDQDNTRLLRDFKAFPDHHKLMGDMFKSVK